MVKARDIPEQTHSGSENRSKVVGVPSAGTAQVAGKSNECDGALIKGPAAEAVREATADVGATLRCVKQQVGGDGSPKHQITGLFRSEP